MSPEPLGNGRLARLAALGNGRLTGLVRGASNWSMRASHNRFAPPGNRLRFAVKVAGNMAISPGERDHMRAPLLPRRGTSALPTHRTGLMRNERHRVDARGRRDRTQVRRAVSDHAVSPAIDTPRRAVRATLAKEVRMNRDRFG